MLRVKIGKGMQRKGCGKYFASLGPLEANLTNRHRRATLEEIAQGIAKSCGFTDGCVNLMFIGFSYSCMPNKKEK